MSTIAAKPASHCRGFIGLTSTLSAISAVASGGTGKLSMTTVAAHGYSVGDVIWIIFAATYESGPYTTVTGTTASTIVVAGAYSSSTTGTAYKGLLWPLYEPSMKLEASKVEYMPMRDSRIPAPHAKNLIMRTFSTKVPMFVPRDAPEVTGIIAFLDKILLPAGYAKTAVTSPCVGTAYRQSSSFLTYDSAIIGYEEILDRELMTNAQCEFGITLDTSGGCWIDGIEFKGRDAGIQTGVATAMPYATIAGLEPVFASANIKMKLIDDVAWFTDSLPCKSFAFKQGNTVQTREDGNSAYGVAGFLVGNLLTGQTHTFDLDMPASHASFPYQTYFKAGNLIKWQMTLLGAGTLTVAGNFGIRLSGVFQVQENVDRGARNDIRTIKVAGQSVQRLTASPDEPFEIYVGTGFDVA